MISARGGPFVATTDRSFAGLMGESMGVMNDGMGRAAVTGDPDHDFAAMMIPHHQGAVDMAKVELLYGKDPVLRRMAQELIVSQQQEIAVMQRRIDTMSTPSTTVPATPPITSPRAP